MVESVGNELNEICGTRAYDKPTMEGIRCDGISQYHFNPECPERKAYANEAVECPDIQLSNESLMVSSSLRNPNPSSPISEPFHPLDLVLTPGKQD